MGERIKKTNPMESNHLAWPAAFLLKVKATALMDESLHFIDFIVLCRLHSHIIVEVLFLSHKILRH